MALTEPQAGSSLVGRRDARDAGRRPLPPLGLEDLHLRRGPRPHREHRPHGPRAHRRRARRDQGRQPLPRAEEPPREGRPRPERREDDGPHPQDRLESAPERRPGSRRGGRLPRLARRRAAPGHPLHVPDDERGAHLGRGRRGRDGLGRLPRGLAYARTRPQGRPAGEPRSAEAAGPDHRARRRAPDAPAPEGDRRGRPLAHPRRRAPRGRVRARAGRRRARARAAPPRPPDAGREELSGREGLRGDVPRRAGPRRLRLLERVPARGAAARPEAELHPRGDDGHPGARPPRPQGRRAGRRGARRPRRGGGLRVRPRAEGRRRAGLDRRRAGGGREDRRAHGRARPEGRGRGRRGDAPARRRLPRALLDVRRRVAVAPAGGRRARGDRRRPRPRGVLRGEARGGAVLDPDRAPEGRRARPRSARRTRTRTRGCGRTGSRRPPSRTPRTRSSTFAFTAPSACARSWTATRAWDGVAAREEVHGGLPALGPRVDREVRLGDHDDAAHALRAQAVDVDAEDLRAHPLHGVDEQRLDEDRIVQRRERRARDVEEEVDAERPHRIPSAPTAPAFAGFTFQRNASHT